MIPPRPLPLPSEWEDADSYVNSLLSFATSSDMFRHLCGGVHILDFLTRDPELYTSLIPEEWRSFFEGHEVGDILDLLMREDIEPLRNREFSCPSAAGDREENPHWRGGPVPPDSLLEYIHDIRRHSLEREFVPRKGLNGTIPPNVAVGMKTKKVHEVENFSRYVDSLTTDISQTMREPISHIADFGSGQNYLGRTLASSPYNRNVIAIERKHHNISGARDKDVHAKLRKKNIILRNKKLFQEQKKAGVKVEQEMPVEPEISEEIATLVLSEKDMNTAVPSSDVNTNGDEEKEKENKHKGSMNYIEHNIQDGYLEPIIRHVVEPEQEIPNETEENGRQNGDKQVTQPPPEPEATTQPRVMVISLHSCGNLVHHGVRSLVMNPSVGAVAMIGCCYNLMTERLGPPTYKLPVLRSKHPRLDNESGAYDPHGFPMSQRLETHPHEGGNGIKLNITARMMAVQAPYNWGPVESETFFTRHFYRALLQRVFLDTGVVKQPYKNTPGTPLIIGSLRKIAYTSFTAYVRTAVAKTIKDSTYGPLIEQRVSTLSDEEIEKYAEDYFPEKKSLSIVWSLMAFSANVVESIIVVDRWLFLREHDSVKDCWVEPVFDYSQSPRNLAVVGIKK